MDVRQGKERGILKTEARARDASAALEDPPAKAELTPQASCERAPASPQPSVDRLSVTWAEPEGSMASSGVNLFHLPTETPISNEVKFSTNTGDGSEVEDEDYSVSLSAVLRQRRASVRRSRKGRGRRPSSPFLPDETHPRRRSSVFTTSSGDTAISMEDGQTVAVTQEQIFETIHLHKEVLGSVKQQPLGMRRKLKIVQQAKTYIKKHEGQLQERLAQSKSTRDIYARINILVTAKWQQLKREAANMSNVLIPWELRIKEIESHFGSVVASYFTFLRWLFWVNLVIAFILMVFVIVPEYLTANPPQDGERKITMEDEKLNATNLLTLWEFEGVLKCSPIFYGYYTNVERPEYRMPLAYFLTGLVVYIYSFVATLRKMAENSRMSKLSEKEDECIFSWKLFTGWDFMIGNTETAHNRIASVILGFKEALLEEAEKKKDLRNWRIITLRALVNVCVVILLAVSAYAVVTVVYRSGDDPKVRSWWLENETTIVVTVITTTFPICFELLGYLEHYHPRKQLRLQLARIMLLNLLNLYSLIFALFSKIEGMSKELDSIQPSLNMNVSMITENYMNFTEKLATGIPEVCVEVEVPCTTQSVSIILSSTNTQPLTLNSMYQLENNTNNSISHIDSIFITGIAPTSKLLLAENLVDNTDVNLNLETAQNSIELSIREELERLRGIVNSVNSSSLANETSTEAEEDNYDYSFDNATSENNISTTTAIFLYDVNDYSTENISSSTFDYLNKSEATTTTLIENDIFGGSTENDNTYTTTSEGLNNIPTENTAEKTRQDQDFTRQIDDYVTILPKYVTQMSSTLEESTETFIQTSDTLTTTTIAFDYVNPKQNLNQNSILCPKLSFNCSLIYGDNNLTQVFVITNCTIVKSWCYTTKCSIKSKNKTDYFNKTQINKTLVDVAYIDNNNRKMYNLTKATKKKLLKLCWETMFGQELVKLTMMDLVFVLLGTLVMDFFRALFVRHMNRCWCWDLEKKFPEYGDFKIAENILHLINNQGMVWMGMFFSPGLVVLNVFKLVIMMYLRSWAVITCNVPHEVVFRVSKSNNFYLALLLTMLFLCVLPVGYSIVWVKPSWHCGPFSDYEKIYHIFTNNIYKILPKNLNFTLEYIASPAIVIPLLVLLILIIYYLISLTNSLREANNDLKIQLRRERTEERRKMFQLADTSRATGSSALQNTPFARWKKALPSLPLSKSIDSDERKTEPGNESELPKKSKKKGGILAKIVSMALDRKSDIEAASETDNVISVSANMDEETDTEFHENLPRDVLKLKDILISNDKLNNQSDTSKHSESQGSRNKIKVQTSDQKGIANKQKSIVISIKQKQKDNIDKDSKKTVQQQTSETSTQSKQSDSIGSVIPVIMISAIESDDDLLRGKEKKSSKEKLLQKNDKKSVEIAAGSHKIKKSHSSTPKSLRRQSSVDSIKDVKSLKEKALEGHKYQYSL